VSHKERQCVRGSVVLKEGYFRGWLGGKEGGWGLPRAGTGRAVCVATGKKGLGQKRGDSHFLQGKRHASGWS